MRKPFAPPRRFLAAGTIAAAALAALPATASAIGPTATADAATVPAGDRYLVTGTNWSMSASCERRVEVSRRLGHGVLVGTARVDGIGSFAFARPVGAREPRGGRIVLDVTQFCTSGGQRLGTTRTVVIRVGAPSRECRGHIAVEGRAYVLRVSGGLGCDAGANAVGPYIGSRISPAGWNCLFTPRALTGYDFGCRQEGRPLRHVTARRIREV
jgi:hypothetical protein